MKKGHKSLKYKEIRESPYWKGNKSPTEIGKSILELKKERKKSFLKDHDVKSMPKTSPGS